MEGGSELMEDIVFRGVEFSVKMEVDKGLLIVEISDSMTADQWTGEFDPAYIEDLTRKTGNFKQFPIFCSMLESAVRKTSDSVTLDLLTYADLELLRNRKPSALTAKRYLILIYTVEFDRIHYPLPLPYVGKPDPAVLQKEIRALRAELSALTSHGVNKSADLEIQRLRAELALVKEEKESMAKVLERLQLSGNDPTSGREDWRMRDVVRTLEEQLVKERAKSQRSMSKRCQEQRLLVEQLEELRASECALRVRVKSLTNELALLRRGRVTPVSGRISSRVDGEIYRSLSRERRSGYGTIRARSDLENVQRIEDRVINRSRVPRFDPTAYIQDRQRRQKEAEIKKLVSSLCEYTPVLRVVAAQACFSVSDKGRCEGTCWHHPCSRGEAVHVPEEAYPQLTRSGSRGRSLSMERRGSRNSSESSLVDMDEMTKTLYRGRKQTYNGPMGGLLSRKPLCSTPTLRVKDKGNFSVDTGTELSEIDARLQALQEYMRDLDQDIDLLHRIV
uniref:Centrosomal protein CCDC61 n=1 Tax=Maylandia zebra TaxID=106582 RepID=A0A3P9D8V3_9CICH